MDQTTIYKLDWIACDGSSTSSSGLQGTIDMSYEEHASGVGQGIGVLMVKVKNRTLHDIQWRALWRRSRAVEASES